jgi:8-oxo-dGTP diphosphatase
MTISSGSMTIDDAVLVFGERQSDQRYVVRPSAYALIQNSAGQVAIVATPLGCFLPGGGIAGDETPERAVAREALEECGLLVRPVGRFAEAVQLVYSRSEATYFEKPSVFLRAEVSEARGEPREADYQLLWVSAADAPRALTPRSHAWAVSMAARSQA